MKEWRYYRERQRWVAYNRLATRPNAYAPSPEEVPDEINDYLDQENDGRRRDVSKGVVESSGPRCKCGSFDLNPVDAICRVCGKLYEERPSRFLKRHRKI